MTTAELSESAATTSRLLRLYSTPARVIVGLFAASNALYALATLDVVSHPVPPLVAMVLVNAGAVLLVLDKPDPFPLRLALAVIGIVLVATLLVASVLPLVGSPGRAGWHLGSNTWLLFFLALRRRPGLAWVGFGLQTAATVAWSIWAERGMADGLMLLRTHATILILATLFGINLRRTTRNINALEARSIESTTEAAQAATAAEIRRLRVAELHQLASPALTRLVEEGAPTDEAGRRRYGTIEAQLRDNVRGRALATGRVSEAAGAARDRGVDVTLLDDRGKPLASTDAMGRAGEAMVRSLDSAQAGAVTVRLAPAGRRAALSIVTVTGDQRERIELDDDGRPVSPELTSA